MEKIKIVKLFDNIILFSLYATAFFLPISKALIESFSILAIVCYLLKKIILREDIPKLNLNFAIFAYLFICFFSIFISSSVKISTRVFWGKITQDVAFFFVVADTLNSERRIRNFLYVLFFSSTVLGIDGIYQHFTHKDFIRNRPYYGIPRIHATFPTPNDFACYLNVVVPFVLISFFFKFRFKASRLILAGLFILLFTCLLLTTSRGGWFAFVSILLFISVWIRPLGIFLLVLGIFIIITRQFYFSHLKERLNNLLVFSDTSGIDRERIWEAAWRMFMHKPWLGLGLGTFMLNFKNFVGKGYPFDAPYAHNCYLQMAAEIGIIGLVSFLSILILFFSNSIETISYRQRSFHWYVLLACMASILGYCVQMTVDTNFYSLDLGIIFWLMLGLGTAAMKRLELEPSV